MTKNLGRAMVERGLGFPYKPSALTDLCSPSLGLVCTNLPTHIPHICPGMVCPLVAGDHITLIFWGIFPGSPHSRTFAPGIHPILLNGMLGESSYLTSAVLASATVFQEKSFHEIR